MTIELKIQLDAMRLMSGVRVAEIRYADSGDGYVYLTLDGYYGVRIPEATFWLDKSKLTEFTGLSKFFDEGKCATKELAVKHYTVSGKGVPAACVLAGDGVETALNAKYFKALNKEGCKLYAKGKNSPVYFTLNKQIYAVCMPMNT